MSIQAKILFEKKCDTAASAKSYWIRGAQFENCITSNGIDRIGEESAYLIDDWWRHGQSVLCCTIANIPHRYFAHTHNISNYLSPKNSFISDFCFASGAHKNAGILNNLLLNHPDLNSTRHRPVCADRWRPAQYTGIYTRAFEAKRKNIILTNTFIRLI